MKNLLAALSIGILLWGTTVPAAERLLTETQLDKVTAGTVGDGSELVFTVENADQLSDASTQNSVHDVHAEGDLDIDNSTDNSQNVNSGNEIVVLQGNAQQDAKAVNIINGTEGRSGIGVNIQGDLRGLNGSSSGGSSTPGVTGNLYQINKITTQ